MMTEILAQAEWESIYREQMRVAHDLTRASDICAKEGASAGALVQGALFASLNALRINTALSSAERKELFLQLAAGMFDFHEEVTRPKH